MATTSHLEITLLEQSQAQKEITINEAFARIDAVLNGGVIDRDLATPPGSPAAGDVYIVGASPTGAWAGKAGQVAYFDQVWRFITPREGLMLWVNDENLRLVYDGSTWQLDGAGGGGSGDMSKTVYDPANIGQQLVGVSAVQTLTNKTLTNPTISGTTTNDNAAAGCVGEYLSASLASGSAITLANGVAANITSLSLSAGDWDVWGEIQLSLPASTAYTYYLGGIHTVSATMPAAPDLSRNGWTGASQTIPSLTGNGFLIGIKRVSIASSTTVYLVGQMGFTAGAPSAYGVIAARRVR